MKNNKILSGILAVLITSGLAGCRSINTSSYGSRNTIKAKELSEPVDKISEANNKVAFKFLKNASAGSKENIIISPLSMDAVLALAMNGAGGKTKEEMLGALELSGVDDSTINKSYKNIIAHLSSLKNIEAKLGNSIWLNKNLKLEDRFKDKGRLYYEAVVNSVDFSKQNTVNNINKWVFDKTSGKINKIVDKFDNDTAMALINTVYFKGKWYKPFENIFKGNFSPSQGDSYVTDMMSQTSSFEYFKGSSFSALRLPYEDNNFGMYLMLPDKDSNIDKLEKDMTYDNFRAWNRSLEPKQVLLQIPKFKIEYEKVLNKMLISFGMESAFDGNADFSGITKDKNDMYLSIVKQKAYVDVNQNGTEAAASTVAMLQATSALLGKPIEFIVDRPFVFVIQDKKTGLIIFMGKVEKP